MTFSSGEASLGRISTASGGPIVAILFGLQNLFCRQRILPLEDISIEDIEDSNMWTVASPGVNFDHHLLSSIKYAWSNFVPFQVTPQALIAMLTLPSDYRPHSCAGGSKHGGEVPVDVDHLLRHQPPAPPQEQPDNQARSQQEQWLCDKSW